MRSTALDDPVRPSAAGRRRAGLGGWRAGRRLSPAVIAAGLAAAGPGGASEPTRYQHEAVVTVERAAPFVVLDLPVPVLAASLRADRADIRLEDARGQPLPFAWLPARAAAPAAPERRSAATLYPWPRAARPDALPESVRVVTRGAQVEVQAVATGRPARDGAAVPGWLIDLGARPAAEREPQAIQLDWPARTPPFTAAYRLSTSDDLRAWRDAGGGHVLALAGPVGAGAGPAAPVAAGLTQARVPLPADAGRFVRLSWSDPATAPALTGAQAIGAPEPSSPDDAVLRLMRRPDAAPAAGAAGAARALQVDLGATLDLLRVQVRFDTGSRVVPVTVQWRETATQPWRDAGATVLYRLERGNGGVDLPPPLPLAVAARQLRFVPDERAAGLADVPATVEVDAAQPRLVFVAQGDPPLRLRVGADTATGSALAANTLVPRLDEERARFGRAAAGPLQADAAARDTLERAQRWARWRPWVLWAVLLAGVAGLGTMVWRLARGR